jgi:hypothetical protein
VRALLAITARELRERWTLPLAMFVWGFVMLLLVQYTDVTKRSLATTAALAAAWGVALLMGGSVMSRDLADGRLAFFFARPVAWWSIAGGKLLAALLLSIAAPIAGLLPTLVVDWSPAQDAASLGQMLAGGGLALKLTLLVALVCFGHVASVVYRARSTWAAVDFLLLGACAWGGVWLFYAFKRLGIGIGPPPPSSWILLLPLLLVAAVPVAASVAQVAVGRSDLRRGHVALSIAFWSGVLAWLVALGALLVRERAVTPATLFSRGISGAAPDGRLVRLLGNPNRLHTASFLFDTATGRAQRVGRGTSPAFSEDGRTAAWLEEPPFWRGDRLLDVQLARLDDAGLTVEPVELSPGLPPGMPVAVALSPRADKLAIAQSQTLSVFDLPSGRALSSTWAEGGAWMAATFQPDGQLKALRSVRPALGGGTVRVEVVTISGGLPASAVPLEVARHAVLISPLEGDLVLLAETVTPRRISLHDTRTGRRVATFGGQDDVQANDGFMLSNGRVAIIESQGGMARLRLAREGERDRVAVLPIGSAFLGELPGGLLTVARFIPAAGRLTRETLFFSSDTAEPSGREPGLFPALRSHYWPARRVAGTAARLFVADGGELLELDPTTRERRVLLPAPAGRP